MVSIDAASGLAELDNAPDLSHSPEEIVAERHMLARIERLIDALPDRRGRFSGCARSTVWRSVTSRCGCISLKPWWKMTLRAG